MGTWCGSGSGSGRPWAQTPAPRGHISIQEVLFISNHHLVHLVHNNYVQLLQVALLTTRLPEYGAEEDHHLLAAEKHPQLFSQAQLGQVARMG